jgi:hypothetical protein
MEFLLLGGTALGIFGFVYKKISRMRQKSKHRAQLSQLSLQIAQPQQTIDHPSLQLASGSLPQFLIQDFSQQQHEQEQIQRLSAINLTPPPLPRRTHLLLEDRSVTKSPLENAIAEAIVSQQAALAQARHI